MAASLAERWKRTLELVVSACARCSRDPARVRIVAVTKTFPAEAAIEGYRAGIRDFGENYVQEALPKIATVREAVGSDMRWHFIGALQSNKAKQVVGTFDLVHSVDRWSLAHELHKAAVKSGAKVRALIEVNVAGEETKAGVPEAELMQLAEKISKETVIEVVGLMSFPPLVEDAELNRRHFARTRELAGKLSELELPRVWMGELSMGVTSDFGVAIEEGATLVRIGTAIFGERK